MELHGPDLLQQFNQFLKIVRTHALFAACPAQRHHGHDDLINLQVDPQLKIAIVDAVHCSRGICGDIRMSDSLRASKREANSDGGGQPPSRWANDIGNPAPRRA